MDKSCFYYGVNTAEGIHLGIFGSKDFERLFSVEGGSPYLKDRFFIELSAELSQMEIENEMLYSFENCCGILCNDRKILIADKKYLNKNQTKNIERNYNLNEIFSEAKSRELYIFTRKNTIKKLIAATDFCLPQTA